MTGLYWEDWNIDAEFESPGRTVTEADIEIGFVMSGSDLQNSGAESEFDVSITDNWNETLFTGLFGRERPDDV